MKNPLLDYEFLRQLDAKRNRETYARITSLTLDNLPVEQIEGVFTGGSISIDGSSAVRRICNLTMTTKNLNMNNIYWGLTTRVKVEVGLKNNLVEYPDYPDIIWFPQGVFIITDFKTSNQVNNYTITLSAKDKMCLLNGDVSGNFNAETDCGTIDWQDSDGEWHLKQKIPIPQIIYSLVKEYAQEPDSNIVIKDIEKGLEILRNNSKNNIYIVERIDTEQYIGVFYKESLDYSSKSNITLAEGQEPDYTAMYSNLPYIQFSPDGIKKEFEYALNEDETLNYLRTYDSGIEGSGTKVEKTYYSGNKVNFEDLEYISNFVFKPTTNEDDIGLILSDANAISTKIQFWENKKPIECVVIKIAPQEDIGYKMLDLYYPDELIAAPNETVVSIFDKIVKAFGIYEYFYDIDGRFIFQAKETYVNTAWNAIVKRDDETYIDPSQVNKYVQYNFEGSHLTTAYQNSPNMGNIKNDYTIWGKKKNALDHEIPIHMRYAIDIKPQFYRAFDGQAYVTLEGQKLWTDEVVENQQEFRKHVLPDTLQKNDPLSWWHIEDWYEYYHHITGSYPDKELRKYQAKNSTGFKGRLCFPTEDNPTLIVYVGGVEHSENDPEAALKVDIYQNSSTFIFDMIGDYPAHYNPDSILGITSDFCHLFNGCYHKLSWFLQRAQEYNYDSYVYQPFIPLEDLDENNENKENLDIINAHTVKVVDWREIIYQMADDYYQYHLEDDYAIRLRKNNFIKSKNLDLYPRGKTGYEQYYHDIEGFWRSLYFPSYLIDYNTESRVFNNLWSFDITNFDDYYNESTVMKIKNVKEGKVLPSQYLYWNKKVFTDPAALYFWFDFFDAESLGLGQFSVPAIGTRPKVVNNDKVKAIIYKGIPNIIISADENEYKEAQKNFSGYYHFMMGKTVNDDGTESEGLATYAQDVLVMRAGIDTSSNAAVIHKFELLDRSSRSVTAQEEIDDALYNYSYCNETVTINTVPIYYLEPNTIISAKDEQRIVNGYYIMNKITIPLTYNGTTSITAIKVPERIY